MRSISGRVVVVTGGAVRIGAALVEGLARDGASVVLHYGHSAAAAQELQERLQFEGCRVVTVQADLSQPVAAAAEILSVARQAFGCVDVLINCAAIFEPGTITDTSEAAWDRVQTINLKAPFFLCQAFVRQLGGAAGDVVNIVDWRGTRPRPGHAAYTAMKAGLVGLTQLMAQELGPQVRVNAVAPGAILPGPGMTQAAWANLAKANPLNRTGDPADIWAAVRFFLESEFITGEVLHVTGGQQL